MTIIVDDVEKMIAFRDHAQKQGKNVHFVPTMGALHEGHCALIREARGVNAPDTEVVVSIFVNPLQFNESSDFDRYPRTLEQDIALAAGHGATAFFIPTVDQLYPGGARTTVEPGPIGQILEGTSRPGHFAGMLTVVLKLLMSVQPDRAFFGEKDYQQLVLIQQMVEDFYLPTRIEGVPIVRENSGLALSSRNRFLSLQEQEIAPVLYRALCLGQKIAAVDSQEALHQMHELLGKYPEITIDYCVITDKQLNPVQEGKEGRILLAVLLGTVRLLDNICIECVGKV